MSEPFYVSAPGKVIIFGEHSAVYNKPAIAAALSLRAYLLVTPSPTSSDTITLDFPDIGLSHSWNKNDLPWDEVKKHVTHTDGLPDTTDELVPEIIDGLTDALSDLESKLHYTACHCFLYLYMNLCDIHTEGMSFCVRSTLPIGAGLGSSASTAVCLASSLAILGGHIDPAALTYSEKHKTTHNPRSADFIDSWSLIGEKCFHGNPSGIDNAVATHGGAVLYQRKDNPTMPSVRTSMPNLPPIKLLLTNTKIPRSTADLVGGVGRLNKQYPKTSGCILDAMGHLTNEAYHLMIRPFFGSDELNNLKELVNINHGLLVSLGVSHPALEKIKIISEEFKVGATKLTGAGGGGCAITLVNDECSKETIEKAVQCFQDEGFETFETSLGGKGVGALYAENVSEEVREKVFDLKRFSGFGTREEIIEVLGVENQEGWKFW
ncbi:mevalonate kinase [[Candida] railenensis]|uniref:Mevalonate kinase n=1 Tax=[Candida] railenensis TaxID=45579 RepID=A0A9P0QSD4_9ASCO|nr:mevalonate kinase [[Candida] railenensis]